MVNTVRGLKSFPRLDGLPQTEAEKARILQLSAIASVICFCLGPEGTNIAQAGRRWIERMGIGNKADVHLYSTPEGCLDRAREVGGHTLAVFWTCAVYANEARFFFDNPDVLPFFFEETMLLDDMQLATRSDLLRQIIVAPDSTLCLPESWRVASHPSPQHLVKSVCGSDRILLVNSNAAAAIHCKDGLSEACITTESARKLHGLETLHIFGSPSMIFFGGITAHGAHLIGNASLRG